MIEEKTFENKVLSLGNFNEDKFFHFKISSPNSLPNYIKLLVKDKNSNNVYNNFVVSYYQDESFMDRKQLSQNSSDTTIMWLSKAQIKEGFYLSIECGTKSCEYNFNIFPENIIVLNLGQTYKYYVTEENEEMIFKIKGSLNINETKLVTIYAKGKKDINSTLNDSDYMLKHLKYNAYIINATKDKEFSKELKVKGSTGDLISVGGFLCEAKEGKCILEELNDNEEYSGFLKKNELKINCFNNTLFKDTSYKIILNDNKNSLSEETFKLGYKCVKLPNNFNEIFYSLRIYKTKSDKNKYISLIPLEIGTQHHAFHLDYEILAFIPIIEEDFNFLTYKIHSYQTDSKAYITICDTYPLCNITLDNLDNYNKLERFYDTFFISYNKSNIENISSISKKKHVIIINCGATLEGDRTIGYFFTQVFILIKVY